MPSSATAHGSRGDEDIHSDMVQVLLVALDAHRVTSGAVRAELRGVIRADDEVVALRESEIMRQSRRLIDVVSAGINDRC